MNPAETIQALCLLTFPSSPRVILNHTPEWAIKAAQALIDAIKADKIPEIYHISQIPAVREYHARHKEDREQIAIMGAALERGKFAMDALGESRDIAIRERDDALARFNIAEGAASRAYDAETEALKARGMLGKCAAKLFHEDYGDVASDNDLVVRISQFLDRK